AGVAFERQGDARKAVRQYRLYLEREPNASDARDVRAKIAALIAALEAAGESLEERPTPESPREVTSGTPAVAAPDVPVSAPIHAEGPVETMKSLLSIQTQPTGARVSLRQRGRLMATGPAPFAETLDEGEYQVIVEHPDYRTIEQQLQVRPGRVYVVIVEMSQGQFLGYLQVRSDPPGAAVYIDEREAGAAGQTPFQNPLPTGEHRVWVERPGYEPEERRFEIGLGEEVVVEVPLRRVAYGRVRIVANVPSATVYIDGDRAGSIPYEGEIPAGEHEIRVSARGMKDWKEDVVVERGQLTPIRVRLRQSVPRGGAWGALTIAAASAGGGLALALMAEDIKDDLERDRAAGVLASDDTRIRRGRWFTIGADAGFGLGGLVGLLSIYYFLRDPLPDSEGRILESRDWAILPNIDPFGGGGLELRGQF
ncbi:MAG: PEGA domain-containing protein, partial [Polyangiaceae bacterium]|nr:PEGA domain-containing protein [Polyangiaceae bacterium]